MCCKEVKGVVGTRSGRGLVGERQRGLKDGEEGGERQGGGERTGVPSFLDQSIRVNRSLIEAHLRSHRLRVFLGPGGGCPAIQACALFWGFPFRPRLSIA